MKQKHFTVDGTDIKWCFEGSYVMDSLFI